MIQPEKDKSDQKKKLARFLTCFLSCFYNTDYDLVTVVDV